VAYASLLAGVPERPATATSIDALATMPFNFARVSSEDANLAMRYAVVAATAFLIDFGLLLLLTRSVALLLANSLAFVVANMVNFALGHVWVFKKKLGGPGFARMYGAVLLVSLVGLAINDALVWIGVNFLETGLIGAKLLATVVAWTWNYQTRRVWIYPKTEI
jgi:putative flippase GtrA